MLRLMIAALIMCGFGAWSSPASAAWYFCRINDAKSSDVYWSEVFEIPGDDQAHIARTEIEYKSYVARNNPVQAYAYCTGMNFGCGYGLNPNPSASLYDDIPRKLGVSFVPGRGVFRCARNHSGTCRTR